MNVAALFDLGGNEAILILALLLILLAARRLPDFAEGLRRGIHEFWKATQEITEEIRGLEVGDDSPSNYPPVTALIHILGTTSLLVLIYECSK